MEQTSLIVLNPNASETMTAGIRATLSSFEMPGLPVRCVTSPGGPDLIASDEDIEASVSPMLALAKTLEPEASGYVLACFSDPGLASLRAQTTLPVAGMREASVSVALSLGARFGVIAMAPESVVRQERSFAEAGVASRWAGSRPIGVDPSSYGDFERTLEVMKETGSELCDRDGADVIILGCAGMAGYRAPLEHALGVPVVDPAQAAVTLLIGRVLSEREGREGASIR